MRKREQQKPYAWTNDAELDRLLLLNRKINEGATIETLRRDFSVQEQKVSELDAAMQKQKLDLKSYYELKEQIEIVFEGKRSVVFTPEQARTTLKHYPNITQDNYKNIDDLIAAETKSLRRHEQELAAETDALRTASELVTAMERVMGGTFVQTLVEEEQRRRETNYIPNGLKE